MTLPRPRGTEPFTVYEPEPICMSGVIMVCPLCRRVGFYREANVLFNPDGTPKGWASRVCLWGCKVEIGKERAACSVRPLTLEEQEPYAAAYKLGGEAALVAMFGEGGDIAIST